MHHHISLNKFSNIPPDTYNFYIEELLKKINQPFEKVDLLLSAWFESDIMSLELIIEYFKSKRFNSIELVLDHWQSPNLNIDYNIPTTFINIMAIFTEKLFKIDTYSRIHSKKGLLLCGTRLERLHRVGLLKSLYDHGFLTSDNLIWSFDKQCLRANMFNDKPKYKMYNDIDTAIEYFDQYSFKDSCDNVVTIEVGPKDQPSNISLYKNMKSINHLYLETAYSVITETYYSEDNPSVTEKTYRAIINRHPFVLVGCPGMLQYLKNFGFKTFDQYFTNSDYDNIVDDIERLQAITENIIEFPTVLEKYKDDIEKDVEYNYILINSIITKDRSIIENIYKIRQLPLDQIDNGFEINPPLVNCNNFDIFIKKYHDINDDLLWLRHYNNIKGIEWPNLESKKDFNLLPEWIQEECRTVFGLVP